MAQEKSDLKGKHQFAVEVLVQAVEVSGAVFQQQWGGAGLAGAMTSFDEVRKCFRIRTHLRAKPFDPLIGQRGELRIDGSPLLLHGLGQRIGEIFILALAEGITRHFDARAKVTIVGIVGGDLFTGFFGERAGNQHKAAPVELRPCPIPIDFVLTKRFWNCHEGFF